MSKLPVFITGNQNKADNLAKRLGVPLEHRSVDLDEIQTLDAIDLIEHKVRQAYEQLRRPVLVEDVSFAFHAWGDLPGPFVKFFVAKDNGVEDMCRMLDGFNDRRATALCTFSYFDGASTRNFQGSITGKMAASPRGEGGYGFDRAFEPDGFDGKTAAELDDLAYDTYYTTIKPFGELREFLLTLNE